MSTTVTLRCNWPNGLVLQDTGYPWTEVTLPFGNTSGIDVNLWTRWFLGAGGTPANVFNTLPNGPPGSVIASGAVQYVSSP